jgi:shikimate dehydrogenase
MTPNVDATPVAKAFLKKVPAVMDIVYSPQETRLLREAKQVGCKTANGTNMLLFQGVAQFELWTGRKAPVDIMREKLFSQLDRK